MSPLSLPVVVGTFVVGSPALYAALGAGTLSVDVALVRVLLCAIGVWAVCSLVASLASKAVATSTAEVAELPGEATRSETA
ncbi:hypothetical protein [Nocardioides pyridinolyticus]